MLPYVIIHNAVSVDGRIDWFTPDVELFYGLAMQWGEDATLTGCDTLLAAISEEDIPEEDEHTEEKPQIDSDDKRPVLVVTDSKGRLRSWNYLRDQPYWRNVISLCSNSTPQSHIEYLEKINVDYIITGQDRADLAQALTILSDRYNIKKIRIDSGGTLNGAMLRAGLVNEVSVLIHPTLVGGNNIKSIFRANDLNSPDGVINLKLFHLEKLKNDILWLKYNVEVS